jgi:hypothetical protein
VSEGSEEFKQFAIVWSWSSEPVGTYKSYEKARDAADYIAGVVAGECETTPNEPEYRIVSRDVFRKTHVTAWREVE